MRNKIILLMLLSIIAAFSYQESYEVLAHSTEIDVMYDNCDPLEGSDGTNEKWYVIHGDDINQVGHLGIGNGETLEIKYYYNTSPSLGNYVWENANITSEIVEEIKDNFSVSMKKWDNIYIYSMNSDNIVTKEETTSEEREKNLNNIIIYGVLVLFASNQIVLTPCILFHTSFKTCCILIGIMTILLITLSYIIIDVICVFIYSNSSYE